MTVGLLALALAAAPWSAQSEPERAASLSALRRAPLDQRMVEISAGFLGTPYQLSPLGEGEGRDPDPRLRFDRADCLSLVEQTLAMALAPTDAQVLPVLDAIRYAEGRSFETRNHLMEAQWLPNNVRKGVLKDLTRALGADAVRAMVKVVDDRAWAGREGRALALSPAQRVRGEFRLDLLPVDRALELLARAPNGAVVVVVRKDRPTEVTRVSHVGLLIKKSGRLYLRHASRSFQKAVDEELSKYLARNLGYAKWTVEGFAVFEAQAAPAL